MATRLAYLKSKLLLPELDDEFKHRSSRKAQTTIKKIRMIGFYPIKCSKKKG